MPLQDTTSDWAEILQLSTWEHTKTVHAIAKVAGKQSVKIPLRSVAMVTDVNCIPEKKEQIQKLLLKHANAFIQDGDDRGYTETY